MKTKMKKFGGFTLIELLVVIVIMGILATISVGTFSSYFAKARDARRESAVPAMKMIIEVANADSWDPDKYKYATIAELTSLFQDHGYNLPPSDLGICYFIGFGSGQNSFVGDDNQFYVATWLESKGGDDGSYLINATGPVLTAMADISIALVKNDFVCANSSSAIKTKVATAIKGTTGSEHFDYHYVIKNNVSTGKPTIEVVQ